MQLPDLLPINATTFERAVSTSIDVVPKVEGAIRSMRGIKYENTPSTWLPFLIYEYGLGELSPFVPNLFDLIREGIAWQRIRGTHQSVHDALAWLNYTAIIEVEPVRRRRWHLFQLGLDRHADKFADLDRIEGVATLSTCARSHYWRGYSYYDVRALEHDYTKWDSTLWDDYSGVRSRTLDPLTQALDRAPTKWSFGRPHDTDYAMTEAELIALDVWETPVPGANTWEIPSTWEEPGLTWDLVSPQDRKVAIINALSGRSGYVTYKDDLGAVIGHRRLKCCGGIKAKTSGEIDKGGVKYTRTSDFPEFLYVEALTDFGQVAGKTATSVTLSFDAVTLDTSKPGLAWVEPGGLGGIAIDVAINSPVSIEFARTIRESTRFFLTV